MVYGWNASLYGLCAFTVLWVTCFYEIGELGRSGEWGWWDGIVTGGILVVSSDPQGNNGSSLLYSRFVGNTLRTNGRIRGVMLGSGAIRPYAKYDIYDVCNGPYPRGSSTTRVIRGVVTTSIVMVTAPICFCAVYKRVGVVVSHYYTHCARVAGGRFCFVVTTTRSGGTVVRHAVSNFHNFLSYLRKPRRGKAICKVNT